MGQGRHLLCHANGVTKLYCIQLKQLRVSRHVLDDIVNWDGSYAELVLIFAPRLVTAVDPQVLTMSILVRITVNDDTTALLM